MKRILIVLVIIAIVAGWFFLYYLPTVPVQVATVKQGVISKIIPEDGLVRTREEVNITAEVAGKIEKLLVDEGKEVKSGDVIAEIEKVYPDAQVRQAEAEIKAKDKQINELKAVYEKAWADRDRTQALAKEGAVSQQALEQAVVTLNSAEKNYEATRLIRDGLKAALSSAKDTLTKSTVKSPIDGVVTRLQRKQGETVVPGTPLMRIINPKTAYIEIQITDSDMGEVKVGQPVRITADGCPGQEFNGILNQILGEAELKGERIDVSTIGEERVFRGVVSIPEFPECLKPGMSLYADIIVESKDDVLVIPRNAVLAEGDKFYVYAVTKGRAEKKYIQVGIKESEKVEVLEGLNERETVVIEEMEKLKDGKRVNIIK